MRLFGHIRKRTCGAKRHSYKRIRYRKPGTAEQNTERLLQLTTQDFVCVRDRTDYQCQLVGRFMSVVLLIERKLVRLMTDFDEQIEERMFGRKIEVYKDFLKAFDWGSSDLEIEDFRAVIGPMREIKAIRNSMAHDLSKVSIEYPELKQTVSYISNRRPDLYKTFSESKDESLKCFGAVTVFSFLFSNQLAGIQCEIQ